jgi:hypothetical protein
MVLFGEHFFGSDNIYNFHNVGAACRTHLVVVYITLPGIFFFYEQFTENATGLSTCFVISSLSRNFARLPEDPSLPRGHPRKHESARSCRSHPFMLVLYFLVSLPFSQLARMTFLMVSFYLSYFSYFVGCLIGIAWGFVLSSVFVSLSFFRFLAFVLISIFLFLFRFFV